MKSKVIKKYHIESSDWSEDIEFATNDLEAREKYNARSYNRALGRHAVKVWESRGGVA